MDIFDALSLIGGLALFLFGMNVMGQALERSAGNRLESMLGKLTNNKFAGLLTGLGVTAVIQSSSATTVMVVGFVNSGIMTLRQAIHVIMGSNIGTTVTAWLISLGGIRGDSLILQMLKPMSFTPILAIIGIGLVMMAKSNRKKDIGTIFLGFAVLMFGMDAMTEAVSELSKLPAFRELFVMFSNPILGVLVGAVLTAIIQSSSASVGILQAFASTGQITFGAAIPIIMGQNIGTCITALISCIGTTKNAKRTAIVHLSFNVIGTVIWLSAFAIVKAVAAPALFSANASMEDIAIVHSLFNIACTCILFPASRLLEKLAYVIVPDAMVPEKVSELDDRLLGTPTIALERCREVTMSMAAVSAEALKKSLSCLENYQPKLAQEVREAEEKTDYYEDIIGNYLVKISGQPLNEVEGATASMLLKAIGDFERISDHAVNLLESAEELKEKKIVLTASAKAELNALTQATAEIVDLSYNAFVNADAELANCVEPLEQVIDRMKEYMRASHIERLRKGECGIEAGFVWSDLITNMERVSDHCSNIAGCTIDRHMNLHEMMKLRRDGNEDFDEKYKAYVSKYLSFTD